MAVKNIFLCAFLPYPYSTENCICKIVLESGDINKLNYMNINLIIMEAGKI